MIHAYPQVFQISHRAVVELFDGPVVVQEKCDGSQFSWGMIDGELQCRSKGQQIIIDAPEGMFQLAIATARYVAPVMHPGWVYRGEFLSKPKHNTIAYSRVPIGNVILYDISLGEGEVYADMTLLQSEAGRLGIECVPILFEGVVEDRAKFLASLHAMLDLHAMLERESILGGSKIEGVVVKNYSKFGQDKKVLMGKLVSADFQEKHQGAWKQANPHAKDIIFNLVESLATEARWRKGVQHMRDAGTLKEMPEDIGPLMREIQDDVLKEEEQAIKDALFSWAWPQIRRGITAGLPEFYKAELVKSLLQEE